MLGENHEMILVPERTYRYVSIAVSMECAFDQDLLRFIRLFIFAIHVSRVARKLREAEVSETTLC